MDPVTAHPFVGAKQRRCCRGPRVPAPVPYLSCRAWSFPSETSPSACEVFKWSLSCADYRTSSFRNEGALDCFPCFLWCPPCSQPPSPRRGAFHCYFWWWQLWGHWYKLHVLSLNSANDAHYRVLSGDGSHAEMEYGPLPVSLPHFVTQALKHHDLGMQSQKVSSETSSFRPRA